MEDMKSYYITRNDEGKLVLSDKISEIGKIYVSDINSINDHESLGLYITSNFTNSNVLMEEFVKFLSSVEEIRLGLCNHIIKNNIGKVIHFKVVCTGETDSTITFTIMKYSLVKNIREYSKYFNIPHMKDGRAYNKALSVTLRKDTKSILYINDYSNIRHNVYGNALSYNNLHMLFSIFGINLGNLCPYIRKHVSIHECNYGSDYFTINYFPLPDNKDVVKYYKKNDN